VKTVIGHTDFMNFYISFVVETVSKDTYDEHINYESYQESDGRFDEEIEIRLTNLVTPSTVDLATLEKHKISTMLIKCKVNLAKTASLPLSAHV